MYTCRWRWCVVAFRIIGVIMKWVNSKSALLLLETVSLPAIIDACFINLRHWLLGGFLLLLLFFLAFVVVVFLWHFCSAVLSVRSVPWRDKHSLGPFSFHGWVPHSCVRNKIHSEKKEKGSYNVQECSSVSDRSECPLLDQEVACLYWRKCMRGLSWPSEWGMKVNIRRGDFVNKTYLGWKVWFWSMSFIKMRSCGTVFRICCQWLKKWSQNKI